MFQIKFLKINFPLSEATFNLSKTFKMALLSLPFMYTGLIVSFWSSVYPTSIANTELFQVNQGIDPKVLLALNVIIQGIGQSSGK